MLVLVGLAGATLGCAGQGTATLTSPPPQVTASSVAPPVWLQKAMEGAATSSSQKVTSSTWVLVTAKQAASVVAPGERASGVGNHPPGRMKYVFAMRGHWSRDSVGAPNGRPTASPTPLPDFNWKFEQIDARTQHVDSQGWSVDRPVTAGITGWQTFVLP